MTHLTSTLLRRRRVYSLACSLACTSLDAGLASAAHLQIPHELLDRPGDEVGRGAGDGAVDHHDSSLDEHASVGDLPRGEARV